MKVNSKAYLEWLAISQQLKEIKAKEATMRKLLCAELFAGKQGEFKEHVETDEIIIIANSKVSRKIDETALLTMMEDLPDDERNCIKFKPSLDLVKYRKLDEDSILHEIIEEKPAMPTLSVEVKLKGD